MNKKYLLGVDDTQATLEALENVGGLFVKADAFFHLFHSQPESHLPARPPSSVETTDWDKVQERQAQQILDKAVSSLLQLGYKRSRLSTECRLQSASTVQDILEVGRDAEIAAIVLARKQRSGVKRLLSAATTTKVCQHAEAQCVWAIGALPLQPPNILAAVDESDYAHRIADHLAEAFGAFPEARVTLFNVMPADPPTHWDDGHILDESERTERQAVVKKWRWSYEEMMGGIFARARGLLTKAGIQERQITTTMQPRVRGIARDILAEVSRGGYNILALGRRGSGKSQFDLGSRTSMILRSVRDCSLLLIS